MYRIYADRREFGLDYTTLAEARHVKNAFAKHFPKVKYYIRKMPA